MIKGISFLRPAGSQAVYDRLSSFFGALGFAAGAGWKEETSHPNDEDLSPHPTDKDLSVGTPCSSGTPASQGASFLAPLGNLEFVEGEFPATADVLVEVTALDAVHQAASAWFRAEGVEPGERLSAIADTHWKSSLFTAEPEPGFSFSFWAWSDPLRGRAVAAEGDLSADGMRFAIVVARWNAVITERLLEGALDALLRSGAIRGDIQVVRVPGAWEIPAAARTLANLGKVDAIVTLGCLLRGETAHYEAIYNEVARGIGQSQQETGIPHSFGVLTCETLEQALNRAGIKAGNKGFEAAVAAIEMVSLGRKLHHADTVKGGPA
jgi:6,7-dimethyl-8-ribityllumazine synthase